MIHKEEELLITEVHRGCSAFTISSATCAHMEYVDGIDYVSCKDSCSQPHCNNQKYPEEIETCECPNDEN